MGRRRQRQRTDEDFCDARSLSGATRLAPALVVAPTLDCALLLARRPGLAEPGVLHSTDAKQCRDDAIVAKLAVECEGEGLERGLGGCIERHPDQRLLSAFGRDV